MALLILAPAAGRAAAPHRPVADIFTGSALVVPAPTSNTTALDVGMLLSVALNTSAVTGASNNSSNWHFVWLGLPTNCTSQDVASYTCVPTSSGTYSIDVRMTDNATASTATSPVVRIQVNPDPTLISFVVTPSKVSVGGSITFTANASGGTPPLVYNYNGLPPGCSGNGSTLTCRPEAPQRFNTSVTVSDSVGFASNSDNLTLVVTGNSTSGAHPTTLQWGIIGGILVVGLLVSAALFVQARRAERAAFGRRPPSTPGNAANGAGAPETASTSQGSGGAPPGVV